MNTQKRSKFLPEAIDIYKYNDLISVLTSQSPGIPRSEYTLYVRGAYYPIVAIKLDKAPVNTKIELTAKNNL